MSITRRQREDIVLASRACLGTLYLWGGDGPPGLDCSGHVQHCLRVADVAPWALGFPDQIRMTAQQLYDRCEPMEDADAWPHAGDLAFYGRGPRKIEHVALVAQTDSAAVTEVHSASGGDSEHRTLEHAIGTGARLRSFDSVDYRPGFIGFRRPYLRRAS